MSTAALESVYQYVIAGQTVDGVLCPAGSERAETIVVCRRSAETVGYGTVVLIMDVTRTYLIANQRMDEWPGVLEMARLACDSLNKRGKV